MASQTTSISPSSETKGDSMTEKGVLPEEGGFGWS